MNQGQIERIITALETIASKLHDPTINERLAELENRQTKIMAMGNSLCSYVEQKTSTDKPKRVALITEQDVYDTIMNATQFKGSNGFIRSDIANLIMAEKGLNKLSEYNQQIITHSLKALCAQGKIYWNGKKTKASRYYIRRESGTTQLLSTGGLVECDNPNIAEPSELREECQSSGQEGSGL